MVDQFNNYWAFFTPLVVLIPAVASASFSHNFESAIKYHMQG